VTAISGHKTPDAVRLYIKRIEKQRAIVLTLVRGTFLQLHKGTADATHQPTSVMPPWRQAASVRSSASLAVRAAARTRFLTVCNRKGLGTSGMPSALARCLARGAWRHQGLRSSAASARSVAGRATQEITSLEKGFGALAP